MTSHDWESVAFKNYVYEERLLCSICEEYQRTECFTPWEAGRLKKHRCRMCMRKLARDSHFQHKTKRSVRKRLWRNDNAETHREYDRNSRRKVRSGRTNNALLRQIERSKLKNDYQG